MKPNVYPFVFFVEWFVLSALLSSAGASVIEHFGPHTFTNTYDAAFITYALMTMVAAALGFFLPLLLLRQQVRTLSTAAVGVSGALLLMIFGLLGAFAAGFNGIDCGSECASSSLPGDKAQLVTVLVGTIVAIVFAGVLYKHSNKPQS